MPFESALPLVVACLLGAVGGSGLGGGWSGQEIGISVTWICMQNLQMGAEKGRRKGEKTSRRERSAAGRERRQRADGDREPA